MSRYEVLIGADRFWARAEQDIAAARDRVLVQAMSFEADAAGRLAAAAMTASTARDRRLLVDAYSLHVASDRLLPWLPFRPVALRREVRATRALFDALAAAGIGVAITNRVGRNPLNFPLRNHKKLLVIDDVAYLGGINFAEHNFAWHDVMVRIADGGVADFLAADFARDWGGSPASAARRFGGLEIVSLDGTSNSAALTPVLAMFERAQRSIELIGAYPTLPFTEAMASAAARGCAVTIYAPDPNNKPLLRDIQFALSGRGGDAARLRLLPRMTHAKAALIDGTRLLFGSVNFNLASWRTNCDLLAISREPELIAAFERQLFGPARRESRVADGGEMPRWRGRRAELALRLGDALLARLSHGSMRRAQPWPLGG